MKTKVSIKYSVSHCRQQGNSRTERINGLVTCSPPKVKNLPKVLKNTTKPAINTTIKGLPYPIPQTLSEIVVLTIEKLLHLVKSNMFSHLEPAVVFLPFKKSFQRFHSLTNIIFWVWKKFLHATLYQKLLIYLASHLKIRTCPFTYSTRSHT